MEKEELKPPEQTYAETLRQKKEEVRENVFKKSSAENKVKFSMSEEQRSWSEKTISLSTQDDFKMYLELEKLQMLNILVAPYSPPPQSVFQSQHFGENMAFKAGMEYALKRLKSERETLWQTYAHNKKEAQNGQNKKD